MKILIWLKVVSSRSWPREYIFANDSAALEFGLTQSGAHHSIFYRSQFGYHILLVVYVNDIVITRNNDVGITELKPHLQQQFQTKDLGILKIFSSY